MKGLAVELYRRSQFGVGVVIALGSGVVVLALVLPLGAPRSVLLIPIGILVLCTPLLSWMTISVTPAHVRFTMGIGLIRRTVPIAAIERASPMVTPWYYGIGIHITPSGPIYNVSGRGAVQLVLKDGKGLLIGSGEPEVVVEAIERARAMHGIHAAQPASVA